MSHEQQPHEIPADLRQQLLELVYDLLGEEETAALQQRITSDPEVARLYAEVVQSQQLLAAAAKLDAPAVKLAAPAAESVSPNTASPAPEAQQPSTPAFTADAAPSALDHYHRQHADTTSFARQANLWMAIAASVVLMVAVGGYMYRAAEQATVSSRLVHMVVTGPARLQAGVTNQFEVTTTSAAGTPLGCPVEYALYAPTGQPLLQGQAQTDGRGKFTLKIPAEQNVPAYSRLEVLALHGTNPPRVNSTLEVEPIKYATQLALDKPLYQPGETMFYRSLTLKRFSLAADLELEVQFEIQDPSGAVVANSQLRGSTTQGVGSGSFTIPAGLAGGEYTLVAKSPSELFPEEKREFFIREYRLPRLNKELEFIRDSYTPGDKVAADFGADRVEGGPAANATLTVVATVDGATVFETQAQSSATGKHRVEFSLPTSIEKGDGQLLVIIDDGGNRETIAKTIPINLGKVDVTFYPEGGDLVPGVENRVYFTGRDPLGKPVHLEGEIVDEDGHVATQLETRHEGLGRFAFTPKAGAKYVLKVNKPAGVKNQPALPVAANTAKIGLVVGDKTPAVFAANEALEVGVRSLQAKQPLVISAYCRGMLVGQQTLVTEGNGALEQVRIPLSAEAGGVIRVTAYHYSQQPPKPVAERLAYRQLDRRLNVRVADHSERYAPGEKVTLSLVVTDENGQPAPAALGVSVVDNALIKLADDKKTVAMPTHFLLTTEIEKPEDLEKADFFLTAEKHPQSGVAGPEALDLLLGTQGWRRFVERTIDELRREGKDQPELTRLAALGGEVTPPAVWDNAAAVQAAYEQQMHIEAPEASPALSLVSLIGAGVLLVGLALSMVMRLAPDLRVWIPAVGASVAAFCVGMIGLAGVGNAPPQHTLVAFASNHVEPVQVAMTSAPADFQLEMKERAGFERLQMRRELLAAEAMRAAPAADQAQAFANQAGEGLALPERGAKYDQFGKGEGKGAGGGGFAAGVAGPAARPMAPGADFDGRFRRQEAQLHRLNQPLAKNEAAQFADKARDLEEDRLSSIRLTVRQYAHQHVASGEPGVRTDFAETLYWHPLVIADASGRAQVQFDLSDSVTTFRVQADAHTVDAHGAGRIGTGAGEVISRIPFNLEPKLPLEVTAGDRIDLPLAVVNDTTSEMPISLVLNHSKLLSLDTGVSQNMAERLLTLPAGERTRQFFTLDVVGETGQADLEFRGLAGNLADGVKRQVRVVPPGFPKAETYAGTLKGEQELTILLPKDWVPGSLEVSLQAFPSTVADLEKGMESILREPHGCFEQASTSNYPNVLTMQYLEEHKVASPEVSRRAKELMDRGYKKLIGYECKQKGYEWFGGAAPGHEALTAYGLMEFRDMAQVYQVDAAMVDRTAQWLLARRDGKGSFQRNARALDSFGRAPDHITDAYIVWALTESGQKGLETELKHVQELAEKSNDPYLVALAAGSLLNSSNSADKTAGEALLTKLARLQGEDGGLKGAETSITRSGGQSLHMETTALAVLAWLKAPAFGPQAKKAGEWIAKHRQGGGFGSTQATILALKALVAQAKASRKTVTGGTLAVKRGDDTLGSQAFAAGEENAISVDGIAAKLTPGENEVKITLSGDNEMPYTLNVSYRSRTPASHPDCPVKLETKLAADQVAAGKTVALSATVENTTDKGQPMTMAILGIPAGLSPRVDQLEELKKAGKLDFFELNAREVVCYFRAMAPQQKTELKLDLVAEIPGKYTAPASRAYLYYTAEQKQWVEPVSVEVTR